MTVQVKICGINAHEAMAAAIEGGADFVGFVFYPPSPRYLTPEQAASVAVPVPDTITTVGLFVDPEDSSLDSTIERVDLGLLQLHGNESPARVAEIRARYDIPIMKAIGIEEPADFDRAAAYVETVDWLLFDAKPPARGNALPGGNGDAFDWTLVADRDWPVPWMLSGGLHPNNALEAIGVTGARAVDVSSGVEVAPGSKSPEYILAFLKAARAA